MNNYIWLLDKKSDSTFTWPFILSLVLHIILFAVLVIKPVYPQTGDTERLDSIWLYFNAQSPGQAAPPALEIASEVEKTHVEVRKTDSVHKPEKHVKKTVSTPVRTSPREDIAEPLPTVEEVVKESEPVTELVVAKEDRKKPDIPKIEASKKRKSLPVTKKETVSTPVEKAEPLESSKKKTLVAREVKKDQAAALAQVREPDEEKDLKNVFPNISGAVKKKIALPENKSIKVARVDQSVDGRVLETDQPAEIKSPQPAVIPPGNTLKPDRNAEVPHVKNSAMQAGKPSVAVAEGKENIKTQRVTINDKPDLKKMFSGFGTEKLVEEVNVTGLKTEPVPAAVATVSGGDSSGKNEKSLTTTAGKPQNKSDTVKTGEIKKPGLPEKVEVVALPRLTGDLKLVITGNTDLKVSFAFREYLKNRRNRPMTAAESRHFVYISPRIARPKENVLEAVLGTAGEGIYDIIVEPANGKPANGALLVRIYENSNRSKTKSLGTRTIKEKTVIARILMPEGIFWDDDNYFSGNLEDSDSITKFNSDTGLVWKEYK
jgi:hypothetical protein